MLQMNDGCNACEAIKRVLRIQSDKTKIKLIPLDMLLTIKLAKKMHTEAANPPLIYFTSASKL